MERRVFRWSAGRPRPATADIPLAGRGRPSLHHSTRRHTEAAKVFDRTSILMNLYSRANEQDPMTNKSRPRVVIVGAGFGGLTAARRIAHLPVQVIVVDRKNHHTFQALLYQVDSAGHPPG